MTRRGVLSSLLLLALAYPLGAQGDLLVAARRLQAGLRALSSADTATYYTEAVAASRLVPPHPVVLYHLARAAALTGRTDSALHVLSRLAPLGMPRDPSADSAFMKLWPAQSM